MDTPNPDSRTSREVPSGVGGKGTEAQRGPVTRTVVRPVGGGAAALRSPWSVPRTGADGPTPGEQCPSEGSPPHPLLNFLIVSLIVWLPRHSFPSWSLSRALQEGKKHLKSNFPVHTLCSRHPTPALLLSCTAPRFRDFGRGRLAPGTPLLRCLPLPPSQCHSQKMSFIRKARGRQEWILN